MKKLVEGRKSKKAIKFEDNYGKPMAKLCKDCGIPAADCSCLKTNPLKEKTVKLKEANRMSDIQYAKQDLNQAEQRLTDLERREGNNPNPIWKQRIKNARQEVEKCKAEVKRLRNTKDSGQMKKQGYGKPRPDYAVGVGKIAETIRRLVKEVLAEASTSQIQGLIGQEAAIKYKKKSTGEVKTYFGRLRQIKGEHLLAFIVDKGPRSLIIANIQDIRPVAKESFSKDQLSQLKKMEETYSLNESVEDMADVYATGIQDYFKKHGLKTDGGSQWAMLRKKGYSDNAAKLMILKGLSGGLKAAGIPDEMGKQFEGDEKNYKQWKQGHSERVNKATEWLKKQKVMLPGKEETLEDDLVDKFDIEYQAAEKLAQKYFNRRS